MSIIFAIIFAVLSYHLDAVNMPQAVPGQAIAVNRNKKICVDTDAKNPQIKIDRVGEYHSWKTKSQPADTIPPAVPRGLRVGAN